MAVSDWSGAALPWFEDLATLKDRVGGLFRRAEPRRQIGLLLEGLIGGAECKNGWQLAEYAGDPAPWRMQALLGRTQWDQEKARDICRDYVIERLGDPSGVLVLDVQECCLLSHTERLGFSNLGSANVPTATAIRSGCISASQNTVPPHSGQKPKLTVLPLSATRT
jgi:hypothetical protein